MKMDDLLSTEEICTPGPDGSCSICADEGVEARVKSLMPGQMALVALPDGDREIAIDLIDGVSVGDVLLVHTGFAIARVARVEG